MRSNNTESGLDGTTLQAKNTTQLTLLAGTERQDNTVLAKAAELRWTHTKGAFCWKQMFQVNLFETFCIQALLVCGTISVMMQFASSSN